MTKPHDDMALPEGMTCADCIRYRSCQGFIGEKYINDKATRCDWSPSYFILRVRKEAQTECQT